MLEGCINRLGTNESFWSYSIKKGLKSGILDQPSEENMWHGGQKCALQAISSKDIEAYVLISTKHTEDNLQSTRTIPGQRITLIACI